MSQTHKNTNRRSPTGTPGWVKLFGIIIIVLALLIGIMIITGAGGDHGPGRHIPPHDSGSYTLPLLKSAQELTITATEMAYEVICIKVGHAAANMIMVVEGHSPGNQMLSGGPGSHLLTEGSYR